MRLIQNKVHTLEYYDVHKIVLILKTNQRNHILQDICAMTRGPELESACLYLAPACCSANDR